MSEQQVIVGDCQEVLRGMEAESAHCCVTSPPYWGLRDYGVDGQLGLESTPEEYLATMVDVFREVRRVLRKDGTFWLVMGDGYVGGGRGGGGKQATNVGSLIGPSALPENLKRKDLIGMPWQLALALRSDGWWLRSEIIWSKRSPMTESCTDRPTTSHEHVFLLAKAATYFYDAVAIREADLGTDHPRTVLTAPDRSGGVAGPDMGIRTAEGRNGLGRNKRSVWTLSSQPSSIPHFAAYPEKLVEPCIKAGTSDKGCCPKCGAPWKRIVEKNRVPTRPGRDNVSDETGMANRDEQRHVTEVRTTGWEPGCGCKARNTLSPPKSVPCTVIDPFLGSGTTLVVARKLGRDGVGIELSEEYAAMARRRIANPHPEPEVPDMDGQLTFGGAPDG